MSFTTAPTLRYPLTLPLLRIGFYLLRLFFLVLYYVMYDSEALVSQPLSYCKDDVLLVAVVGPTEDLCYMLENSAKHNYLSLLCF